MKRSADREPPQNKKQKTSHGGQNGVSNQSTSSVSDEQNFQPVLRRSFQYLLGRPKVERPPGHILGTVKMIYPPAPGKERFIMELAEVPVPGEHGHSKKKHPQKPSPFLEVKLAKLHLENLDPLTVGTRVKLSLKGGRIDKLGARKTVLPVGLSFTEGYHLRFGKNEIVDINTFITPPAPKPTEQKPKQTTGAMIPPLHLTETNHSNGTPLVEKPRDPASLESVKAEALTQPLPVAIRDHSAPQDPTVSTSTSAIVAPMPARDVKHTEASSTARTGSVVPIGFSELNNLPPYRASVIGIVKQSRPARECKGGDKDWMKALYLSDHSRPDGISANLFFGRRCPRQHDVNPEDGDVLILVDVRVEKGRGTPLVGSGGLYRWAICSKKTKRIYWTDPGQVGPPARVEGSYHPFYEPTSAEVAYCQQLLDWWDSEMAKVRDASKNYVVLSPHARWARKHKLVSELSMAASSAREWYFDCTVEVLRFFESSFPPHSLWVTDYTKNEQCFNPGADWCPAGLAPYAFRIECWDESIQVAQELQESVLCRIENCRSKASNTGYLEGKQCQAKIYQLAETSDDKYLKALLERKKAWQTETGHVETKYNDGLFKDAILDRFFNCTVEILHHEYSEAQKMGTVFCTDYTTRDDAGGVPKNAPWAEGLERNEIVKIVLNGGQAPVANMVKRGDFCRFNKIRLKVDQMQRHTVGFLGGNQSLMEKLNPKNKDNETLQALIRRKDAVAYSQFTKTFKDILHSKKFPFQYKVIGRVVGQDPENLDEAITLWCSKCSRDLNSREKRCMECESDDNLEPRSNLFLNLEDRELGRVFAHLPETSPLLDGIDLSRFLDDRDIRDAFKHRIQGLRGESSTKSRHADAKAPCLVMDVRVWLDKTKDVGFLLMGAIPSSAKV